MLGVKGYFCNWGGFYPDTPDSPMPKKAMRDRGNVTGVRKDHISPETPIIPTHPHSQPQPHSHTVGRSGHGGCTLIHVYIHILNIYIYWGIGGNRV